MASQRFFLYWGQRLSLPLLALTMTGGAMAAASLDTAFVGKVSQGGRFEVEAGKLAQDKATSPDVKAFATKDVDDHVQVNTELKTIADAEGIALAPVLNHKFRRQLKSLGAKSGADFDLAYVDAMAKIHAKDEAIFAKEAQDSADPQWKAFASKTDGIVKGHINDLTSVQRQLK